ncbi:MAG: tetratricopeptide repeat protein [Lachnospiraceae bacterium]|nr:tetratricopeptide repeat protein [Lachnospiraceae bacterium]
MDKYEYQVCTDQIKSLIAEKRFAEAMEIADTIDWRRVRSVSMLVTVSEIYKVNKRYEDAKDILLLAYERHPNGRDIVYALCELFIKLGDVVQAIESYKEFMAIAPEDANSYILLYKIYKAQDVSIEEQIDVLEEYKSKDYREKWAYELAYLYHKIGEEAKCVAECDELILWFGEGKYVRKAMELKMQHTSLSKDQQAKYDGRYVTTTLPVFEQPVQQNTQFGNNAQQTGPMLNQYGEYILETGQIGATGQLAGTGQIDAATQVPPAGQVPGMDPNGVAPQSPVYVDAYGNLIQYDAYGNPIPVQQDPYQGGIQVTPGMNHLGMTQDIMAQALGTGAWNAAELQDQIGSGVREAMTDETGVTAAPIEEEDLTQILPQSETAETKAPEISVHTGVIDLSEADLRGSLPGDELPDEQSDKKQDDDIMSALEGVIPGSDITGVTSKINGPRPKPRITGEIPDVLPSIKDKDPDFESDENDVEADTEETDDTEVKYGIKDETESREEEISRISAVAEKAFPGYVAPEIPEDSDSSDDAEDSEEKTADEDGISETKSEVDSEPEKEEKLTPVGDDEGHYPYDTVTDIGYVEELPEIEQPEDVDEILKTGKIPTEAIEKATAYETDSLEEVEEYEVDEVDDEDEDDGQMPSFMRADVRARREFDDDEYKIFCRYDGMEALKAQLVDAMDAMSMEPGSGNVVIMGPESTDTKGIAISIVKAMQSKNPSFSGKVAKISGEALNKKNIKLTLEKLENGALIVERAGGLTNESVVMITSTLEDIEIPVLVILEGTRESIKPLFKYSKRMKHVFDARIDIAEFTNDDLVSYGRGYALEKEYSIDEMGGLALHNRISELQTFDHKVTIDEVKEIIDTAIRHVDKKNMGHLMDMLLGRRYDDEDNIILGEKDFIF